MWTLTTVSYTHLDVYKRQGGLFNAVSADSEVVRAGVYPQFQIISYNDRKPVSYTHLAEASDSVDVYEYQAALRPADMLLMKADLSAKDATLTFTFTTPDYMEKEAAEKLKPFLRRPIVYSWNQGKAAILP